MDKKYKNLVSQEQIDSLCESIENYFDVIDRFGYISTIKNADEYKEVKSNVKKLISRLKKGELDKVIDLDRAYEAKKMLREMEDDVYDR